MKCDPLNLKSRYSVPSQNANTCHVEHSHVLPIKLPVPYIENAPQKFSVPTRTLTLPACRAQTCFRAIEAAAASLRCPAVPRAVGDVTSFSLPVRGTLALQSAGAAAELALPSAGAVIGAHIETGDRAARQQGSRSPRLINNGKSDAEQS